MGAVDILVAILGLAAGLATMACFVIVLVEMFKRQQTAIAIACIVLFLTTLTGPLVAFVFGWMKAKEWGLRRIMLAWTGCLAVAVISVGIGAAMTVARAQRLQQRADDTRPQVSDVEELKIETH